MKEPSIKVSKKHGVNPSMTVCFWCDKETGVALLGELPNDMKAPRHVFDGYEPCDECKEQWKKGVVVMETEHTPYHPQQPAMGKDQNGQKIYPSGNLVVMDKSAFKPEKLKEIEATQKDAEFCIIAIPEASFRPIIEQAIAEGIPNSNEHLAYGGETNDELH